MVIVFECRICGLQTRDMDVMIKHLMQHREVKEEWFSSHHFIEQFSLGDVIDIFRQAEEEKLTVLECKLCNKRFLEETVSPQELIEHVVEVHPEELWRENRDWLKYSFEEYVLDMWNYYVEETEQ